MSIPLDSIDEDFDLLTTRNSLSAMACWHGRTINWDDFSALQAKMQCRIMDLLNQGNLQSELLMFKLAWVGTAPHNRPFLEKQIAHLLYTSGQWEVREVNLLKEAKKGWKNTKEATTKAWETTCEVASKAVEAVQEFWEEYHAEIITGAVIIATAVVVTTLVVCAGGVGADAALAGGAALIGSVSDSSSDKAASPSVNQSLPNPPPAPSICLENCVPSISADKLLEELEHSHPRPRSVPYFAEEDAAPPMPRSFYPPLNPALLYYDDYIAKCYEKLGWQPPFATLPPSETDLPLRNHSPAIQQELRPNPTGGDFARFIEGKLTEAKDPHYLDQFPKGPDHQQFVTSIENALGSTQDREKYLREFWEKEHDFIAANQSIEQFRQRTKPNGPIESHYNNYASRLISRKPPAPIIDIPLLGYSNQSTVHYHCGINNTYGSIVDAGLRLNNSCNAQFAVQPHLTHSNSLLTGLGLVKVEQFNALAKQITAAGADLPPSLTFPDTDIPWPEIILQHSHIQKAIDYEVATLSQIAQEILKSGQENLKQVHVTFSNAGYVFKEALNQLTPEERSTIIVIPVGTTALIHADSACEVYNVIGDKDWPSISCIGGLSGIEVSKDNASIEIVMQNETEKVIGGHYFTQPDYQQKIQSLLDQLDAKYELY